MRLINEDDVLRIVERVTNEAVEKNQRKYLIQPRIIAEIAGLPTIEAEPVKHGHWKIENHLNQDILFCTQCEKDINVLKYGSYYSKAFKFCPYCGARMGGDSDA